MNDEQEENSQVESKYRCSSSIIVTDARDPETAFLVKSVPPKLLMYLPVRLFLFLLIVCQAKAFQPLRVEPLTETEKYSLSE